ncbi:protein NYNRIN-like [Choloepus didactylus]|uniref:protein NYNRIN-like n=1 Tax=Choloepus didactylus TaxID=27675 RepID=UPI00189C9E68|nr:protein NYNRIN-like [Choloepus didactylus]
MAKEAALKPVGPLQVLPLLPPRVLKTAPTYSDSDIHLSQVLQARDDSKGWKVLPDSRILLPEALGRDLILQTHQSTHLGGTKLAELLRTDFYIPKLFQVAKEVSRRCHVCAQVNPSHVSTPATPGHRLRGQLPGEQWEIDFTELPPGPGGYKYLLVLVDTFSGWVEAYPTRSESAQVVAKKLLAEIIPRFGLPVTMGSDNGLAFIAQVTQNLVKALGIEWKLHCIYRPQSSGQVERMNRTLKETLTKLKLETGRNWVSLLPFALLKARCTPYVKGITPYEAMFGRPPPLLSKLGEEQLASLSNSELLKSLQALHCNSKSIHHTVRNHHSKPDAVEEETPTAEPGDLVWIKKRHPSSLEARWAGPYQVILSTPTAVKVAGKRFWIHHSQIKRADSDQNAEWVVQKTSDPLKLRLRRRTPLC